MEKRHGDAESVVFGELHALADLEAVVDDVVVGQHHSLGKPCGSRGVLHIDDFEAVKAVLDCIEFIVRDIATHVFQLIICQHAVGSPFPQENGVFQKGQFRTFQRTCSGSLEFRNHRIESFHIIGILEALHQKQSLGIRLVEHIFQLGRFIVGIDRDQY